MAGKTNREIEVKVRVHDIPEMTRRLRQIGAVSRGRSFEENALYDTPDCDFRCRGRLLRLRIDTPAKGHPRALFTSKSPLPVATTGRSKPASLHKERLERELAVRDPDKLVRVMKAVGLAPSFRYEKYRTSFRLSHLHLDLDETPVGNFLELEGRPADIDRVARMLGYSSRGYIRGTYWDLYAADCRRRGRRAKNMLFPHKISKKRAVFP